LKVHCQHGKKSVAFLSLINAFNATTRARERCFEPEQRGVQLVWCCDPPVIREVGRDARSGERRRLSSVLGIVKTKIH
jgi:hypothetical protein